MPYPIRVQLGSIVDYEHPTAELSSDTIVLLMGDKEGFCLSSDEYKVVPSDPHFRRRVHTNYFAVRAIEDIERFEPFTVRIGQKRYYYGGRKTCWLVNTLVVRRNGYEHNGFTTIMKPVLGHCLRNLKAKYPHIFDYDHGGLRVFTKYKKGEIVMRKAGIRLGRAPQGRHILLPFQGAWERGCVQPSVDPRIEQKAIEKAEAKVIKMERAFLRRRTIFDALMED